MDEALSAWQSWALEKRVAVVTAVALVAAPVFGFPYAYYELLRVGVTAAAVYFAFDARKRSRNGWALIFAGIAVIFNPLIPFGMDRGEWLPFDFMAAGVFLTRAFRGIQDTIGEGGGTAS